MTDRLPPAPDGLPVLGNTVPFVRSPFSFIASAVAEHGDVVRLSVPGRDRYIVAHPDLFERVLVTERAPFAKTADFRLAFGDSVIAVGGDAWREQRDLLDPFFYYRRIAGYVPAMREQAVRRAETWTPGETLSVVEEMKGLTFDILAATLLGLDSEARGDDSLRRAADDLNAYFAPTSWALPGWVPTPSHRRFGRAVETLRAEIERLLETDATGGDDLLSMLAAARDGEGYPRSDADVSDQLVAILFAGHETTAIALTFAWYLLDRNPSIRERVEREVDAVVGGDPVGPEHLAELELLERVLKETMRRYPPIHTLPRVAARETTLGGYRIPEGTELLLSVVNVHRDDRFYERPERFDPDRWAREDIPDYAYAPFGAGPRRCVGRSFATAEAKVAMAELIKRYRLA